MSLSCLDFLTYPIIYILSMPILVLFHELGHAISALILTDDIVSIYIGTSSLNKKFRFARLTIYFNGYSSLMDISYGCVNWNPMYNNLKSVLMNAAGPLVSLLIAFRFFIILDNYHLSYFLMKVYNGIFIFSFSQFLFTIFPIKYTYRAYVGFSSDGYKILQHLKILN